VVNSTSPSSSTAALTQNTTATARDRTRATSPGTITLLRQLAYDWRCYANEGRTIFSPLAMTGFWVVAVHRYGAWANGVSAPMVGQLCRAAYRIAKGFVVLVTGARIGIAAQIGQRLNVHTTQGLQIAGAVRIGDDCVVNSGVCIVHAANNRRAGAPTIGNNVYLGVGAKVIGNVKVGNNVQIGANAVVGQDIPDNMIVLSPMPVVLPLPSPRARRTPGLETTR
jgi:serine O-acetyltransferase